MNERIFSYRNCKATEKKIQPKCLIFRPTVILSHTQPPIDFGILSSVVEPVNDVSCFSTENY